MPQPDTSPAASGPQPDNAPRPAGPDEPEPDSAPRPQSAGAIHIDLTLELDDDDPPLIGWLEPQARDAALAAGATRGELSIAVVGDTQMAELHQQYKDVPGTTDVLTFDLSEGSLDDAIEGEIIVCLDEARRQAAERGHSVRQEILLYVVHGILHLLGEDDHDPAAYEQMHAREDAILTQLGFGPVFTKGDPSA